MLTQLIKTPLSAVYVCPIDELQKHFPGNIVAKLLSHDEAIVIEYYDSHIHTTVRYFITPKALPK